MEFKSVSLEKYIQDFLGSDYGCLKVTIVIGIENLIHLKELSTKEALEVSMLSYKLATSFKSRKSKDELKIVDDVYFRYDEFKEVSKEIDLENKINAEEKIVLKSYVNKNESIKNIILSLIISYSLIDGVIENELIEVIKEIFSAYSTFESSKELNFTKIMRCSLKTA